MSPTTSSSAATRTVEVTATLSPEEVVIRDYLHHWEVYSDALYNLDPSRLTEVMTGPRLERALKEIEDLRNEGHAVDIDIENRPVVVQLSENESVVADDYENRSRLIDPTTKEPIGEPRPDEVIRTTVTLTRTEDTWKVLESVREVDEQ